MKQDYINGIVDKLFIDCEKIADKYETNLLNVLSQYTNIEQEHKDYNYLQAIHATRKYFRNELKQKKQNDNMHKENDV